MVDLSSHENQAIFKKKQRISLATNLIMTALSLVNAALAIWALTTTRSHTFDWAEIVLIILPCIIIGLCVVFIVLQVKMIKPYNSALHGFVAQCFEASDLLGGEGDVKLEMLLVGDKLTLLREGTEGAVQLDLSPVKSYTTVCAAICAKTRSYLYAYCFLHADGRTVTLTDRVSGKDKLTVLAEGGTPAKDCQKNYFIKNGLIK